MSKPEPCLCFEIDLGDGTRRVVHGPPCNRANAPKAVSEPPIDDRWVDTWAEKWAAWPDGTKATDEFRTIARAHVRLQKLLATADYAYADMTTERDALKAQNAELVYSRDKALRIADENANASQVACSGWDRAKAEVAKLKAQNAALEGNLSMANAEIAALQEAHDHAQTGLKSARKQEGEMREQIADLTTEVERLKDLAVEFAERYPYARNTEHTEIGYKLAKVGDAARAAREAGKTS